MLMSNSDENVSGLLAITSFHDMPQYKSGYIAYDVNMHKLTAYR